MATREHHGWLALACGLLALALVAAAPPPASPAGAKPPAKKELDYSGGPYCGVYSVYAALRVLDLPVSFPDLLEPKYVGSFFGSTAGELRRAVSDSGGHAEVLENLTVSALRNSDHPVLLHVRRPGLHTPYAHWVLFLGVEDGKARIVDPPHAVELLPLGDLLSLWDGVGIVVSRRAAVAGPMVVAAWLEHAVYLLLAAVLVGGANLSLRRGARARPALHRWLVAPLALVAVAVGLAALAHAVGDEGFFRNRASVGQVAARHFEPDVPTATAAEVAALVGQPGVTFIDARFPTAYNDGHLPGAVNLPVFSGLVERADTMAAVRPTDRVVVYCQSGSCAWADVIAADLVFRGYRNVAVFKEGWNGWEEHEQPKPDK